MTSTRWPREMKYDNVVDETYDKICKLYKKWNPYSELNEKGKHAVKDILREWSEFDYETISIFKISDFNEKLTKILFPSPIVNLELKDILEPKNIKEIHEKINQFKSEIQKKLFDKVYPEISKIEFRTNWNKKTFWLTYNFNETGVELCGTLTSRNPGSMVAFQDGEDIYLTVNNDHSYEDKIAEFEKTPEGDPIYRLIEKYRDVSSVCEIEL